MGIVGSYKCSLQKLVCEAEDELVGWEKVRRASLAAEWRRFAAATVDREAGSGRGKYEGLPGRVSHGG